MSEPVAIWQHSNIEASGASNPRPFGYELYALTNGATTTRPRSMVLVIGLIVESAAIVVADDDDDDDWCFTTILVHMVG